MGKYIDAEKLIANLERQNVNKKIICIITSLQQKQDIGEISDGYHTFNELYRYRMLYNAAFFNLLPKEWVHKSKRHHTGEECFGGGWFIVMANLPTGQISNHYELKDWDLFQVPEKEFADEWDGHTPQEAAERLHKYLQQEHPTKRGYKDCNGCKYNRLLKDQIGWPFLGCFGGDYKGKPIAEIELCPLKVAAQQEQPKVDLVAELKHHLATTPKEQLEKEWKELEHWRIGPTVQEFLYGKQPEVDLENEYKEYVDVDPVLSKLINRCAGMIIARHFYELGLNARKEENK